jgi:hypothetical protein
MLVHQQHTNFELHELPEHPGGWRGAGQQRQRVHRIRVRQHAPGEGRERNDRRLLHRIDHGFSDGRDNSLFCRCRFLCCIIRCDQRVGSDFGSH